MYKYRDIIFINIENLIKIYINNLDIINYLLHCCNNINFDNVYLIKKAYLDKNINLMKLLIQNNVNIKNGYLIKNAYLNQNLI